MKKPDEKTATEDAAKAAPAETKNVDGDEPLLVDPFITFVCNICAFEEKCLYNSLSVADGLCVLLFVSTNTLF